MTSTPSTTVYDRVGQMAGVAEIVAELYERVRADAELAPFFHRTDMVEQRRKLAEMIAEAMGGPSAPWLLPLREAHAGRGITHRHFSLLASHLADVLDERGVEADEADTILDIVSTARPLVVDTDL